MPSHTARLTAQVKTSTQRLTEAEKTLETLRLAEELSKKKEHVLRERISQLTIALKTIQKHRGLSDDVIQAIIQFCHVNLAEGAGTPLSTPPTFNGESPHFKKSHTPQSTLDAVRNALNRPSTTAEMTLDAIRDALNKTPEAQAPASSRAQPNTLIPPSPLIPATSLHGSSAPLTRPVAPPAPTNTHVPSNAQIKRPPTYSSSRRDARPPLPPTTHARRSKHPGPILKQESGISPSSTSSHIDILPSPMWPTSMPGYTVKAGPAVHEASDVRRDPSTHRPQDFSARPTRRDALHKVHAFGRPASASEESAISRRWRPQGVRPVGNASPGASRIGERRRAPDIAPFQGSTATGVQKAGLTMSLYHTGSTMEHGIDMVGPNVLQDCSSMPARSPQGIDLNTDLSFGYLGDLSRNALVAGNSDAVGDSRHGQREGLKKVDGQTYKTAEARNSLGMTTVASQNLPRNVHEAGNSGVEESAACSHMEVLMQSVLKDFLDPNTGNTSSR